MVTLPLNNFILSDLCAIIGFHIYLDPEYQNIVNIGTPLTDEQYEKAKKYLITVINKEKPLIWCIANGFTD